MKLISTDNLIQDILLADIPNCTLTLIPPSPPGPPPIIFCSLFILILFFPSTSCIINLGIIPFGFCYCSGFHIDALLLYFQYY